MITGLAGIVLRVETVHGVWLRFAMSALTLAGRRVRTLPLASKQTVEERILDLPVNLPALAKISFALEAQPLEGSD
jgi:hypothetical protein